jgi:four helix bundle protein
MRYPRPNSKSEIRDPKEHRSSKSEGKGNQIVWREDSEFWTWGDVQSGEGSSLREDSQTPPPPPLQNLEERTARFGEATIRFAKKIPQTPVNSRLISQLVGAGTSVGANFCEASDAVSGKDFRKSIGVCRKESKESMFFLRMTAAAEPSLAEQGRSLWGEAKELNLIFGSIWRKGR